MSDSVPVYDDKKNVIGEATVDGDRVEVQTHFMVAVAWEI